MGQHGPPVDPSASTTSQATFLACSAHEAFRALPRHGKPLVRANGVPEWTILACIALLIPESESTTAVFVPISLGTGVKCLPADRLPPLGDTLHDSHAEILARRGFVRWLIEEASRLAQTGQSDYLELVDGKIKLRSPLTLWLYASALPCGDASTLHTAAHQPADMALLKSSSSDIPRTVPEGAIRGRNGYTDYGAIRTKPGRTDSKPSISFSCSDKIASWSVLGLQGGLLSEISEPIYLDHVVVGGIEEVPPEGWGQEGVSWRDSIRGEVDRALFGRLEGIADSLQPPYQLHRPEVHFTSIDFPFSKCSIRAQYPVEPATSVYSLSSLPRSSEAVTVIYNGSKSGVTWKSPGHTLVPEKGRSRLCKVELLRAFLQLKAMLPSSELAKDSTAPAKTYFVHKHRPDSAYQRAKALLRGTVDGGALAGGVFGTVGRFCVTSGGNGVVQPPFAGWIVSGEKYESFTVEGTI